MKNQMHFASIQHPKDPLMKKFLQKNYLDFTLGKKITRYIYFNVKHFNFVYYKFKYFIHINYQYNIIYFEYKHDLFVHIIYEYDHARVISTTLVP